MSLAVVLDLSARRGAVSMVYIVLACFSTVLSLRPGTVVSSRQTTEWLAGIYAMLRVQHLCACNHRLAHRHVFHFIGVRASRTTDFWTGRSDRNNLEWNAKTFVFGRPDPTANPTLDRHWSLTCLGTGPE